MNNAAAAAKREELQRKKESWFAQRLAAQEREKLANESSSGLVVVAPVTRCDDNIPTTANQGSSFGLSARAVMPSDDQVLDRITERITSRIREEVRTEVLRDVQEEARKKGVETHKIEGYLTAELEQAICPICFEMMTPPDHTPILIFPCGHTFCKTCLNSHVKANRSTCPYCRAKIQSQAPNMMMQQLIESFANKKALELTKPKNGMLESQNTSSNEEMDHIALSSCDGDARDQVEHYIREFRNISMRWRIYDNEAADCMREIDSLKSKRHASKLVKEHLMLEMTDAQRRLEEVKLEIELIQTQIEQQAERDMQAEVELIEKTKRQQLLSTTKDNLELERDKIRLLVKHYLPEAVDVDTILR